MAKKWRKVTIKYQLKSGIWKTKTYYYSKSATTLVTKAGKIKQENVDAFKAAIDNNNKFTEAEKRALKADIDAYVKIRSENKTGRLTTTGFLGHLERTKLDRYFTNAGISVKEFADAEHLNEADVRAGEWKEIEKDGKKFMILKIGNKKFKFNNWYDGDFYERYYD